MALWFQNTGVGFGIALRVAFDVAGAFPGGEETGIVAVLVGEDSIEFAQQLHAATGEGGEPGGAADALGEAVVLDRESGVHFVALGEDLLDEIRVETALDHWDRTVCAASAKAAARPRSR